MRGTARCGLRPTAVHPDLTALTRRERRVRLPQPRSTVQPGARAALAPPPLLFSPTFSPALASLYPPPSPFAAHQSPFATANPSRHPLASPACSPYTHPPPPSPYAAHTLPTCCTPRRRPTLLAERAVPRALGAPAVAVAGTGSTGGAWVRAAPPTALRPRARPARHGILPARAAGACAPAPACPEPRANSDPPQAHAQAYTPPCSSRRPPGPSSTPRKRIFSEIVSQDEEEKERDRHSPYFPAMESDRDDSESELDDREPFLDTVKSQKPKKSKNSTRKTPRKSTNEGFEAKAKRSRKKAVDEFEESWELGLKDKILADYDLHLRILRYEPIHFDIFLKLATATEDEVTGLLKLKPRTFLDKQAINIIGEATKRQKQR
ncbi:hypothetical protein B0H14DRAFT_3861139 [Mycena olivaceomarginata]|nr:hypothetical protein B0H14DRAFT_3861139 [Mycena olivaceomarginata]